MEPGSGCPSWVSQAEHARCRLSADFPLSLPTSGTGHRVHQESANLWKEGIMVLCEPAEKLTPLS